METESSSELPIKRQLNRGDQMRYPNINAERARMGLSWGQLAGILGVTRKTLYNWTTKGDIPQNALIQMTDIFGCSPDYLLSEAVADEEPLTEKQTLFAIRLKPQYEDEFSGGGQVPCIFKLLTPST